MKGFKVSNPGVFTTIQDLGRPGYMKYGIPASGAADRFSAQVANLLVGNPPGAALLEVTLFRLELLALNELIIAVTGGNLSPNLNGKSLPMWQALALREGDRVAFRARKEGFRAYLAIQGGFSMREFLGSRSVFVRGLMGNVLQTGEILEIANPVPPYIPFNKNLQEMIPIFANKNELRVILGPQDDRFTPNGIETFLTSAYRVSSQSDRMGYRLEGSKIEHLKGADIISEPIARGAIQVPGDGLPILLLWDAQVSGGYTKIANVISADLDRLAQIMPGENLQFKSVTLQEAHEALREERAGLERIRKMIEERRP
ncbi:MAG: biotin-dependent carboxyltransferase family protein [Proteobacteria bacterium]|nr:biotin-dependent carboxyltransferase family protein [Pseudomonadota bacterium]